MKQSRFMKKLISLLLIAASAVFVLMSISPAFAASDDEYDSFGRSTADMLISGDAAAFTKSIDKEILLDSVFKDMSSDAKTIAELRKGLSMGLDQIGDIMVRNLSGAKVKYLRPRVKDDQHTALIRIDFGDKGINFLDIVLKKNDAGDIKIIDWYDYSKGQYYTESVAQAIGLMLPEETTFLEKLLGTSGLKKKEVDQFVKLGSLMREQKYEEWLKLYDKLPDKLRESRILLLTRILVTVAVGDDDAYRNALKGLYERFGDDPTLSLILIDHYYFEEDYDAAQRAIDKLSEYLGGDATLDGLKANIYLTSGDYPNAIKYAQIAIKSDAEYEDAYWTLLDASVFGKKYDTSVNTLKLLETEFGYEFSPEALEDIASYKEFVKSDAYKKWKEQSSGE